MEILALRNERPRSAKKILAPRCRQQGKAFNDAVFNVNRSTYGNCVKDCKTHRNNRARARAHTHTYTPPLKYRDSDVTALYFDGPIRYKELQIHKQPSNKFLRYLTAALFGQTTQHTGASFRTNAILSMQHKALYITSLLQSGSENVKVSSLT